MYHSLRIVLRKYTMYQDFRYTLAHAQTVCTRPSFRAWGRGYALASYQMQQERMRRPGEGASVYVSDVLGEVH